MSDIKATTADEIQVGDTIVVNEYLKVFAITRVAGTINLYCEGMKDPIRRPADGLIYREVAR